MNAIRVLFADDHALVRAGLRTLIEKIASASPLLALLMLALVSPGAVAQAAVEMPRTIRVVMDNAYAPYSFQSDEGKLQGILIDQWQAWEKKTGIKVEVRAMDWGEALRRIRAGEFDVIDSIVETPERRDYFDFTPGYTPIEASIFFRNDISGITDIASLKRFPVGVKAGDQHIDKLKANGVTTVILFQNNDAIIEAAKQHKINVFVVDDPSALYLLNKMGIESEFRHSTPIFRDKLRRAVRKGDAALLRTMSEGFTAIEPSELKRIDEKWHGHTIDRIGRYLTYAGYAAAVAMLLVAGLVGWNRTLRKKVLQRTAALRESEQRFRRLVELMPVAVYVCDTSGKIQSYNRRAVELWGRKPKLGDTAQRYCASLRLWSLDGKLVPHEESKMAEVLRTGVPAHDLEVVIERPTDRA
jgi:two-component system cell cycle sensor histidine kinase/response regulator CckA